MDFFSVRWRVSGSQPLSAGFGIGSYTCDLGDGSYACSFPFARGLIGLNSAENVRLVVEAEPAELPPRVRSLAELGGGGSS
jgi:hypothetical protein